MSAGRADDAAALASGGFGTAADREAAARRPVFGSQPPPLPDYVGPAEAAAAAVPPPERSPVPDSAAPSMSIRPWQSVARYVGAGAPRDDSDTPDGTPPSAAPVHPLPGGVIAPDAQYQYLAPATDPAHEGSTTVDEYGINVRRALNHVPWLRARMGMLRLLPQLWSVTASIRVADMQLPPYRPWRHASKFDQSAYYLGSPSDEIIPVGGSHSQPFVLLGVPGLPLMCDEYVAANRTARIALVRREFLEPLVSLGGELQAAPRFQCVTDADMEQLTDGVPCHANYGSLNNIFSEPTAGSLAHAPQTNCTMADRENTRALARLLRYVDPAEGLALASLTRGGTQTMLNRFMTSIITLALRRCDKDLGDDARDPNCMTSARQLDCPPVVTHVANCPRITDMPSVSTPPFVVQTDQGPRTVYTIGCILNLGYTEARFCYCRSPGQEIKTLVVQPGDAVFFPEELPHAPYLHQTAQLSGGDLMIQPRVRVQVARLGDVPGRHEELFTEVIRVGHHRGEVEVSIPCSTETLRALRGEAPTRYVPVAAGGLSQPVPIVLDDDAPEADTQSGDQFLATAIPIARMTPRENRRPSDFVHWLAHLRSAAVDSLFVTVTWRAFVAYVCESCAIPVTPAIAEWLAGIMYTPITTMPAHATPSGDALRRRQLAYQTAREGTGSMDLSPTHVPILMDILSVIVPSAFEPRLWFIPRSVCPSAQAQRTLPTHPIPYAGYNNPREVYASIGMIQWNLRLADVLLRTMQPGLHWDLARLYSFNPGMSPSDAEAQRVANPRVLFSPSTTRGPVAQSPLRRDLFRGPAAAAAPPVSPGAAAAVLPRPRTPLSTRQRPAELSPNQERRKRRRVQFSVPVTTEDPPLGSPTQPMSTSAGKSDAAVPVPAAAPAQDGAAAAVALSSDDEESIPETPPSRLRTHGASQRRPPDGGGGSASSGPARRLFP